MTGMFFDVYLAVDWSGRSAPSPARPSPDSVWVAEYDGTRSVPGPVHTWYLRTRHDCEQWLRQRLVDHVERGRRVLAGFDFPFGYPAGFAAALGLGDRHGPPPWRLIWDELDRMTEDAPDNRNNRFEVAAVLNRRCTGGSRPPSAPGPLWGCPRALAGPWLQPTSPAYPYLAGRQPLPRLRRVERSAPGTQPGWKLMGAGSVGSQCLLGIPVVSRLRSDPRLRHLTWIWPFETGFTGTPDDDTFPDDGTFIVHAEVWPGTVARHLPAGERTPALHGQPEMIKDEAQVRAVVRWLHSADRSGSLGELLAAPARLPAGPRGDVLNEEAWILGY